MPQAANDVSYEKRENAVIDRVLAAHEARIKARVAEREKAVLELEASADEAMREAETIRARFQSQFAGAAELLGKG